MHMSENLLEQRKKIGQYAYSVKDVIGKGYSSVVYRALSECNGTPGLTKDRQSP
jgi:hypothetical protein